MQKRKPSAVELAGRSHRSRTIQLMLLVLVAFGLAGCSLSRERVRSANLAITAQQDTQLTCDRPLDACALASAYAQVTDRVTVESSETAPRHFVNLLDDGADSLALRVHLIRAARHSIDVQTFIFADDDAGYLILDELIRAARRGVRVRVIADQLFSTDDTGLLTRLAWAHRNFEIRLFNPSFEEAATQPLEFAANILCCFFKFNQRMHNKLLLIDGTIGIAGGRNYEDRYFDWDQEFDYRDRDVLVGGPVAGAQMLASFELFWTHTRTRTLAQLKDINKRLLSNKPPRPWEPPHYNNPTRVAALIANALDEDWIKTKFVDRVFQVGRSDYFSDTPDKPLQRQDPAEQELTRHIIGLLEGARQEIVLQTPYLVISKPARRVFAALHKQYPELSIVVSTNSLAATDAFYVYALSYKYKKRYVKGLQFQIHEFMPYPQDAEQFIADYAELAGSEQDAGYRKYGQAPIKGRGARLGLHAKSIVIDRQLTLIGSHNFDPRSDNYNTESGFIIHDAAFAEAVRGSILRDAAPRNSWTIARRPRPKLIETINGAIGDVSTALPLFDFWPFRYAASFALKPGCEPLPASDPGFYDCYEDVGEFPEVDLPLKTIYTRIVTAFGAGLFGIL